MRSRTSDCEPNMDQSNSARPQSTLDTATQDIGEGTGKMKSNAVERSPAEVNAYWDDVRTKLWIEDDEIAAMSKKTYRRMSPKMYKAGGKALASQLEKYDSLQREMIEAKRRISTMPSAERR